MAGAWLDNVIVERLWRSIKYEEVCLRTCGPVSEARGSIGRYLSLTLKEAAFEPCRKDAGSNLF
jgi:hypothetical protein